MNTDLMFSLFIQSLRVLAGMLCFMLDLLMDWPLTISLRAAWRLSSLYCLYLRTGAEEEERIPDLELGDEVLACAVIVLVERSAGKFGLKFGDKSSKGFCMAAMGFRYGFVHITFCIA